jgi:predicted phosphoribosyltransferase
MLFKNRTEAGKQLAQALEHYRGKPGVIFPLPRGGVALGVELARMLEMPIDLVIPRKVGHPANPEYAICAVSETGDPVCSRWEKERVDPEWLRQAIETEKRTARSRRERFLGDKQPLPLEGKTAVIVDDGIATGLTMRAAILEIKSRHPARIVIAIPVAPAESVAELEPLVDEVVGLEISDRFLGSVGAYYSDFTQVSDDQVVDMLRMLDSGR